uniref:Uncharacterized protein n=1 Tax=Amphimedon queenslandica TaxID=400682 RepID=A0A1X7TSV1_AMPQE
MAHAPTQNEGPLNIAIGGCCHGKLDLVYDKLLQIQEREGIKLDLFSTLSKPQPGLHFVFISAIRDQDDLNCMAVPDKYKQIGSFHKGLWEEHLSPWLWIELDVFNE